ncbi:MAG: Bax inhibitor-1/YccA family protein [Ruminococcus sp.]|nr:Bax inhibitor-1/YccA family protein [Ruminococcus sp.]MBQ4260233.1 Bax inhibitor-1/YccA family protein [Ruminococcus sp.]
MRTTNNGSTKKKSSLLASNPVMRRLDKVNEYADDNAATFGGITGKTIYFLLFSVVGIFLQLILAKTLAGGQLVNFNIKGFEVSLYMYEIFALLGATILAIIFQLLAFFARGTTPVTGALYCVTQGYFISFLVFKVLRGFEYLGALALLITMLIVVVMAVLYSTGIIRVTKKFRMVMLTLFITIIAVSLFTFIGSFIPFTQPMIAALRQNFVLSIVFGVIFIIIAALFLICDFNTIDHVVNDRLPKKYEWQAAFGLSFTVLWLYLKVLDLIITIAGHNKN